MEQLIHNTKTVNTSRILKELDDIWGIEDCKEKIENYAKYLQLKSKNKINIGNYNIMIRCKSEHIQIEQLVQIFIKLLKANKIINTSSLYLDAKQLKKNYNFNEIDKQLLIVDSDIINLSNSFIEDDLKKCIQTNKDKIFMIINRVQQNYFWRDEFKSNEIVWKFELDEVSEKDKTNYINQILKQNNMKIDKNCNMINVLKNKKVEYIKQELMNIIIDCKTKNTDKITNKILGDLNKREYLRSTKPKVTKAKKIGIYELNELEGLEDVKKQVQHILNYVKVNKERGTLPTLHMCFNGNPGVGKTSIARVIGKIFAEEKILSDKNVFVEIHARDLIDQYVGWTAPKVKDTIRRALGGVLFIDEAYSLISDRQSFEDEAIATLIKEMEDKRDNICIILAGYTNEMKELLAKNPGFESRINFHIQFPDYTEEELYNIFKKMVKNDNYKIATNVKDILVEYFRNEKKKDNFSNGRCVRNLFEKIKFQQADRVANEKDADINLIKRCDIEKVLQQLQAQNTETKRKIGF